MSLYSLRTTYVLTGLLLGIGAPVGALVTRILVLPEVRAAPLADVAANRFFYIYQLVGTCAAFAVAGSIAGERAERLRRAESFYQTLAEHDPLTGLLNTRAFRDRYERSRERASRIGYPLSLLLIDVDHLKRINDEYGHTAGNDALLHVAHSLRVAKRTEDSAARWGGDEFAILLDGGDDSAAMRVANNVLARVRAKSVFTGGRSLQVTVTIGVCTARKVSASEDLFSLADRALYAGKDAGRDRAQFVESSALTV
ncbi:MAG TPA: GGDEF domain-containing protein [Thermoanaerobaculia bacterium]|jgi:diguanylate cyclase (GGDEF)-like protein|nr:GGDEF domain-containing protein [Thermoanaerobaculia bacterium]